MVAPHPVPSLFHAVSVASMFRGCLPAIDSADSIRLGCVAPAEPEIARQLASETPQRQKKLFGAYVSARGHSAGAVNDDFDFVAFTDSQFVNQTGRKAHGQAIPPLCNPHTTSVDKRRRLYLCATQPATLVQQRILRRPALRAIIAQICANTAHPPSSPRQ
ncbi:hypothetical protein ABIC49_000062 [Burkholderia ambifaria]